MVASFQSINQLVLCPWGQQGANRQSNHTVNTQSNLGSLWCSQQSIKVCSEYNEGKLLIVLQLGASGPHGSWCRTIRQNKVTDLRVQRDEQVVPVLKVAYEVWSGSFVYVVSQVVQPWNLYRQVRWTNHRSLLPRALALQADNVRRCWAVNKTKLNLELFLGPEWTSGVVKSTTFERTVGKKQNHHMYT